MGGRENIIIVHGKLSDQVHIEHHKLYLHSHLSHFFVSYISEYNGDLPIYDFTDVK